MKNTQFSLCARRYWSKMKSHRASWALGVVDLLTGHFMADKDET